MEWEFGSCQPVRWAKGNISDFEGKIINCSCGKPAVSGAIGLEAFKVLCKDCSPDKDDNDKYEDERR